MASNSVGGFQTRASAQAVPFFTNSERLGDYEFQIEDPTRLGGALEHGFFAGLFRKYIRKEWVGDEVRTKDLCQRQVSTVFLSVDRMMSQETVNQVIKVLDANHNNNAEKTKILECIAAEVKNPRALFGAADYFLAPSVMNFALRLDLERNYEMQVLYNLRSLPIEDPRFKDALELYTQKKEGFICELSRLGLGNSIPVSYSALVDVLMQEADAKIAKYTQWIEAKNLAHFWQQVHEKPPFNTLLNLPVIRPDDTDIQKAEKITGCLDFNAEALSAIQELDLSRCRLEVLPSAINRFTSLRDLRLGQNRFKKFPDSIFHLTSLRILYFSNNQIEELPESIGDLNSLEEFILSENQIRKLPASFGKLRSLKGLYLSANKIQEFPALICNLVSLQTLYLHGNEIEELPDSVDYLASLRVFYLFCKPDCGGDFELNEYNEAKNSDRLNLVDFWDKLQTCPPFNTLQSRPVILEDDSVVEKAEKIRRCLDGNAESLSRITRLDLSNCKLVALPSDIDRFTSLQHLYLSGNKLRTLPNAICKLSSLCILDLSHNEIQEFPRSSGNLTSLRVLNLANNSIEQVPLLISRLTSLQGLHLANNRIEEVPYWTGNLRALHELHLTNNRIERLPSSIGDLRLLQGLYLSDNRLESLPDSIGYLVSLERLHLYDNKIRSLPDLIRVLGSLRVLHLFKNEILEFPDAINDLSSLQELTLSDNPLMLISDKIIYSSNTVIRRVDEVCNYNATFHYLNLNDSQLIHSLMQVCKLFEEGTRESLEAGLSIFESIKREAKDQIYYNIGKWLEYREGSEQLNFGEYSFLDRSGYSSSSYDKVNAIKQYLNDLFAKELVKIGRELYKARNNPSLKAAAIRAFDELNEIPKYVPFKEMVYTEMFRLIANWEIESRSSPESDLELGELSFHDAPGWIFDDEIKAKAIGCVVGSLLQDHKTAMRIISFGAERAAADVIRTGSSW